MRAAQPFLESSDQIRHNPIFLRQISPVTYRFAFTNANPLYLFVAAGLGAEGWGGELDVSAITSRHSERKKEEEEEEEERNRDAKH